MRLLCVCLALLACCLAVYASTEANVVVELTDDSFDNHVKQNKVTLVKFYAPWCVHCQNMAPEYEEAAKILQQELPEVSLAKVDATEHRQLQSTYNVKGFPTLKVFRNGKAEEYRGGRTKDQIVSHLKQITGPAITIVKSDAELDAAIVDEAVVYVSHTDLAEGEIYEVFDRVADQQRTKGKFIAYVGSSVPHGEVHVRRVNEDIVKSKLESETEFHRMVKDEFFPLFGPITGENYADYSGRDHEIVWFCGSPTDYEENSALIRTVASHFRELYSFVWLDSDQYGAHATGALGITEFPGLVLQSKTGRFVYPTQKLESAGKVRQFFLDVGVGKIEKSVKSEDIPETNDAPVKIVVANNFKEMVFHSDKDVFLEVYAPWCGHCKRLEPLFDEMAEKLTNSGVNHIIIAKMDGTTNESVHEDFEWTGFPTLFFVKAGEEKPLRYDGARTVEGMIEFFQKKSSKEVVVKDIEGTKEDKVEETKEEL